MEIYNPPQSPFRKGGNSLKNGSDLILKKTGAIFSILLLMGLLSSSLYAQDFKKDQGIANIRPAKPVRVELRRDPKGGYTWQLSGSDVNEIMKADTALRNYMKNPNARPPAK